MLCYIDHVIFDYVHLYLSNKIYVHVYVHVRSLLKTVFSILKISIFVSHLFLLSANPFNLDSPKISLSGIELSYI